MNAPTRRSPAQKRARRAEAQRAYRARQKGVGAPSRDDIARQTLHWVLTTAIRKKKWAHLDALENAIVEGLVGLGFSEMPSRKAFGALIDRCEGGWEPRRQPILRVDIPPRDEDDT